MRTAPGVSSERASRIGGSIPILTGLATDMCVLITAADAHMRDLEISVPRDCAASATPAQNRMALEYMKRVLDADTTPSTRLDLSRLRKK